VTLDALNHPILAWAELESFRVTGDRSRRWLIYEPLARGDFRLQVEHGGKQMEYAVKKGKKVFVPQ
jgi:hypothetical protein